MYSYADPNTMHAYVAAQNHLASAGPGLHVPWAPGPELMNHAGVRIFRQYGDLRYSASPITDGASRRLVPVGVAYVEDTGPAVLVPRHRGRTDPASSPVAPGRDGGRAPPASPPPGPPSSCSAGSRGGGVRARDGHRDVPGGEGGVGPARGPSRKRKYDERGEGEAARAGIPDGWYKCSCCVSGWYHVDDEEESECSGARGRGGGSEQDGSLDCGSDTESQDTSSSTCTDGVHVKVEVDD